MDAISVVHEHGETGLCGGGGGELRVLGMRSASTALDKADHCSLEPPPGSEICGFFGTSGAWMDSLGIVYTA